MPAATTPLKPEPKLPVVSKPAGAKVQKPESEVKNRHKAVFRVKIGKHQFDSAQGEILNSSYVWLTTHRLSTAMMLLNDPDGAVQTKLANESDIEIEIGFADGERRNKLIGKIQKLGRRAPDATIVMAVDVSTQLAQTTGSTVTFAADKPADPDRRNMTQKEVAIADQVKSILKQAGAKPTAQTIKDIAALVKGADQENLKQIQNIIKEKKVPAEASAAIEKVLTQIEAPVSEAASNQRAGRTGQQSLLQMSGELKQMFDQEGEKTTTTAQLVLRDTNLKFKSQSNVVPTGQGTVSMQQTQLQVATQTAVQQGNVLVARGNTIAEVQPGKGEASGLVLDYIGNRGAFIGKPKILRRTGLQLPGSITVKGWDVTGKTSVSATVTMQSPPTAHPTGTIVIPEWKDLKLNDPIFPGCPYTWADATYGGQRVPTKEIAARIVAIAQRITPLTEKTIGKGKKWNITSWYRDPAANRAAGGASGSRHMSGDAVDFWFEQGGGEAALFQSLQGSWDGGLARKVGVFVHLDDRGYRERWNY